MSVSLREFSAWLDALIPIEYQEPYDNSGLQVGEPDAIINSVMLTLDITPDVIAEAATHGVNLIVSHHPLIFSPLKHITSGTLSERCVAEAIRKNIAIYSSHTCFDAMSWGVSHIMAEKIGLNNIRVLVPVQGKLFKIAFYVPVTHAEMLREVIFEAGAGHIGKYSDCSFAVRGEGTFRPGSDTNPFSGKIGELFSGEEVKIETVVPSHLVRDVVAAIKTSHPYEEVAYDICRLDNEYHGAGTGAVGELTTALKGNELLMTLKDTFATPVIRFSGDAEKQIRRIAVCGGAGAGFVNAARKAGADAFITGDIKYHAFVEAPSSLLLVDIGHFESEIFSLKLLYDLIIKKFPKFALRFSETKTNPINYF